MRRQSKTVFALVALAVTLAVRSGLPDRAAALVASDAERHMSANNPWSKDYQAPEPGVYYPNCSAARAAGAAPIYAGSPGYRPEMDGDSDGIACEPYH
jgi:hypothetical protein